MFTKMIELSTIGVFEMASEEIDEIYNTGETKEILETIEDVIEDWLNDVFDKRARLSKAEWVDIVSV